MEKSLNDATVLLKYVTAIFSEECVYAHNVIHKRHGVSPIVYDERLGYETQRWTNQLAKLGALDKDKDHKKGFFQEISFLYDGVDLDKDIQTAVIEW